MSGGNWAFGCEETVVPCSSCGKSRGRGPRSAPTTLAWLVFDPSDAMVAVKPSRAEAAKIVRDGNASTDVVAGRWRYEVRRVALDGSSELLEALRTGRCAGCQSGRVPVQPKGDS